MKKRREARGRRIYALWAGLPTVGQAQVQIASARGLSYDKAMRPLRSKSLALGMVPLLWAGLLLQSGAWACGCFEHNPWLLTLSHCVGDLVDHTHPAELAETSPNQELGHHHVPGRDAYLSDAQGVEPPADQDVEFLSWHLVDAATVATRGALSSRWTAPPERSQPSGPLRALLQVYRL